ncbi:MAG: hypothetical protein ACLSDJ_10600 [Butyricimonas faecihominis]
MDYFISRNSFERVVLEVRLVTGMLLELSNREETLEIEVRQAAATEEYEYVLPVIFL